MLLHSKKYRFLTIKTRRVLSSRYVWFPRVKLLCILFQGEHTQRLKQREWLYDGKSIGPWKQGKIKKGLRSYNIIPDLSFTILLKIQSCHSIHSYSISQMNVKKIIIYVFYFISSTHSLI